MKTVLLILLPLSLEAASVCQWTFSRSEVVSELNRELSKIQVDYYLGYEDNGNSLFRLMQIIEDRFAKKDVLASYPGNGLRRLLLAILVEPSEFDNISRIAQDAGIDKNRLQQKIEEEYGLSFNQLNVLVRTLAVRVDLLNSGAKHIELKDVLQKWGMSHSTNFKNLYRDLFGETLSETFKKRN